MLIEVARFLIFSIPIRDEQMNITKAARFIGSPRQWLKDDLLRRLIANATMLFSGNMAASVLGLASLALTARALGVEQFGILVLITTYVTIVSSLFTFQSWQAIIKYGADALEQKREQDFKSLIKFGFMLDGATVIVATVLASTVASFIGQWKDWDMQHVLMATIYSATILFHLNGTPIGILRLFDRFKKIAYQNVIAAIIKLLGVTIAYAMGTGIWGFLLVWAIVDILGKLVLIYFAFQELSHQKIHGVMQGSARNISNKFNGIWGFVWTTNINSSVRMTTREMDVMIIAVMLGPIAVGLYKIAKQFAAIIQRMIDPLYQSIYPELARLFSKGAIEEFVRFGGRASVLAGLIALGSWFVFYFFGDYIIRLTVGMAYSDAIDVMLWYMMAIVVAAVAFPLQPAMLSMGRPHMTFWVHMAGTVIYFAVLFSFLPVFGLIGAGIAYLIYYISWSLAMLAIEAVLISRRSVFNAAPTD